MSRLGVCYLIRRIRQLTVVLNYHRCCPLFLGPLPILVRYQVVMEPVRGSTGLLCPKDVDGDAFCVPSGIRGIFTSFYLFASLFCGSSPTYAIPSNPAAGFTSYLTGAGPSIRITFGDINFVSFNYKSVHYTYSFLSIFLTRSRKLYSLA